MNESPARRPPWSLLPEFSRILAAFPSRAGRWPPTDGHLIHLEDLVDDGHYIVRAELPGIDPAKDVDVTVRDSRLTIKAERTQQQETKGRSEFSYGSFVRSVALPAGANAEDISATYDKGILTVSVPVSEPQEPVEQHVVVQSAG